MAYRIPDPFKKHMTDIRGQQGADWVEGLPRLLDDLSRKWHIVIEEPFEPLSYNYVAPVILDDHSHAVIKVGYPHPEFDTEIAALEHFSGHPMVQILRKDHGLNAILIESVYPGNPLSRQQDDHYATQVVLDVIDRLPLITNFRYDFPTIHIWGRGFDRYLTEHGYGINPIPSNLVTLAGNQFKELVRTMGQPRLLHGDLHHGNILYNETGEWKSIDPKGVIGELSYEFGAFLRNPYPDIGFNPNLAEILHHRVEQITDAFPVPGQRVWRWAFSQSVLSAIWSLEDEGYGWESMVRFAEVCLEFIT